MTDVWLNFRTGIFGARPRIRSKDRVAALVTRCGVSAHARSYGSCMAAAKTWQLQCAALHCSARPCRPRARVPRPLNLSAADEETGQVEWQRPVIVRRYLQGWFVPDFVSAFPLEWLFSSASSSSGFVQLVKVGAAGTLSGSGGCVGEGGAAAHSCWCPALGGLHARPSALHGNAIVRRRAAPSCAPPVVCCHQTMRLFKMLRMLRLFKLIKMSRSSLLLHVSSLLARVRGLCGHGFGVCACGPRKCLLRRVGLLVRALQAAAARAGPFLMAPASNGSRAPAPATILLPLYHPAHNLTHSTLRMPWDQTSCTCSSSAHPLQRWRTL